MAERLYNHGAAAVLTFGSKIYYENLFSTRSLGSVTDLIVAKFLEQWPNGLQIRSLALYAVYEATRCQGMGPVTIECGCDGERWALSVAFKWNERAEESEFENLQNRLKDELGGQAGRIVLRREPETSRIDLLLVSDKSGDTRFELIEGPLDDESADQFEYIQLADLDFREILAGEALIAHALQFDSDRLLVKGTPDQENLILEIEGGALEKVVNRIYQEKDTQRGEMPEGAPVWRWVQRSMTELVTEKQRLNDFAKLVRESLRNRAAEAVRKDEALILANQALAQAQDQIEQMRANGGLLDGEAKSGKGPASSEEEGTTRALLAKTQKQVEEFKRANQQLLHKLHQLEHPDAPPAGSMEDLKLRLQAAMKQLAASRKQAEKLSIELEKSRAEEAKLNGILQGKKVA